ncbi:unnamed protein product [Brassica rapa]|uniref:non-specific serine/threonine protein kinase n=2 Tax=Brassica campestris TaxID=3711 RepID=A0A8D9FZ60_BRACM|nr:unnamed protein product [Brassica rapa]
MLFFLCFLLISIFSTCGNADINTSSPLSIGQTLSSPNGVYELGFFSPNNTLNKYVGVWFKNITPQVVVWVANRDKPVTKTAANLTISSNGSLILLDGKQDVIWSTGEAFTSNKCHAELLDTGNLVVTDDVSGKTLWQSFGNLGNTMLPQSSVSYDIPRGKKHVLTSWKSNNDPSPGEYSLEFTPQVPPQGLIRRGSKPYWRSGPWAKTKFSGIPGIDASYVSPFTVVQDVEKGTASFSYSQLRNYKLSYVTLTSEGKMKILWSDGKNWTLHFAAPVSSCDLYGACGPFGLCLRTSTPKCVCMKGFVPKSDEEWRQRNWTSGCVRHTQLSCQANSSTKTQGKEADIFYHMKHVKTPDMYQFASFLNAEQCHQGCLGNCSCTAFAYISGIGCLVWNRELVDTVQFSSDGESLSLRLASSELVGSSRTMIIAGATASLSLLTILVFSAYTFWRYRAKQNAINSSSPLSIGQTLSSPGGFYELGFFSPNNTGNQYIGIWFKKIVPRVIVWVANRDKPVTSSAANLTISRNGSLTLVDEKQAVIWSTGEASFPSSRSHAELLDTGNLVLIDDVSRTTIWESFENLGNTMLPQSTLMYDLSHGKKRELTSWKSYSDPSLGNFSLEITPQVPLQGLIRRGSVPYWRTGPWAKTRFTGFPQFDESYVSPFSVVQDLATGTGSFSYSTLRNFNLSYLTLTPEGNMEIYWDQGQKWMHHLTEPEHSCDIYGTCGPFGLCVRSSTPRCICLKGFVPKKDVEWRKGNWTSGCVRRAQLSCQAKSSTKTQGRDTDIFYRMTNVKTPDLHQFASFLDADMCYQGCLGNCSCTAFAYISGIGCLVWNGKLVDTVQFMSNGETISIRLASSELAGSHRTKIIVATTACLSIFAILVFTAFMFWRYRAKQKEPTHVGINTLQNAWKNDFEPQDISGVNFFEMHTIRTATDNFSSSNKLGQGGFGPVYKGKLLDGKEIAAKRLSSSSDQGTGEFLNEIRLISKLQHRNLVRLLGYCIEGEEKLLIYEFMVNKSLDIFLFDSTLKLEIDWAKRFEIIQGIARGLLYLHRDSRLRVIHRDLKVSNILLDEKMNPKISDFGLARMFQGTQYQDNTRRVVGTLGYMSPEYAWAGLFSEKSDIYSLGVLMLEIISGKKISRFSFGDGSKGLLAYAWESWFETGGADLLDQDLTDSCNIYEVARCVQIGLLCVQHEASDRPNTLQVLSMITSTTELPTPKQPIFAAQTLNDVFTSESESKHIFSVNDLTQSVSGPPISAKLGICMSSDVYITLCKCSVKCLNEMQCFKGDALDTYSVSAITRASPLSIGQTLSSPDGSYEFGFFSPNNSRNQYVGVWFKNITPQVVVWVGNRDKPVTKTPANLTLSTNGSLVLLQGEEQDLVWSIGETFSSNELRGELLDNGNFVLVDAVSGRILWQSFEHLGDTMLPQSSVMYNVPNNNKRVLSSWKSPTDPSSGEFIAELTTQLPPQGFIMRGTRPYWRGGPWARERFTGTPEMDDSHVSQFSVSQDASAGTGFLTYSLQRNSNLSYTTLTPEGSLKIRWHDGSGWVTDFEAPVSSCDVYNTCGPYGLCVRSNPPKCECLKGFIPRSDEEWNRRNWTGGCVRRTDLSCRVNSSVTTTTQGNGADVFDVVANVKPPDFYEYLSLINAEECSQRCRGNCSCMAFSFVDQIGCLVWYRELVDVMQFSAGGEVLSIRLASSELGGSNRTKIIVASAVSVCVFMIMVLASYWFWRRRHKAKQNGSTPTTMETSEDAWKEELKQQDVYFFDMQTILAITDNFSIEKKLGQGGFGPVYKGKLQDGKEIAIKRLSSSSGQGKQEFMNEIVLISKLQHRNLVRLMGCCIEGEEKLLIYEFLVNKSLNTFIFDSTKKLELDWPKRFEIIQGIACGLLYLHRDSCLRVVHRDLKVSNILLDEEMNPKISDFGLARMFQGTQHQANTRRVVGTLGYMSPEYAWTGMFSEKSDIYAFGVLLLEIITGKRISSFTIGEEGKSLLEYTWDCWRESGGADLLDQDISSSGSDTEVARCVQIGLLCIQQQALDRPNIAQVMSMLTTEMDLPEPKQPVFALQIQESDSDSKTMYSVNEITQTAIFGR